MPTSLIDSLPGRVVATFAAAMQPSTLVQLCVLGVAAILAFGTARFARSARDHRTRRALLESSPRSAVLLREVLLISAPYAAGIAVLIAGRAALLPTDLDSGLAETIEWYRAHESWWRPRKDAIEAAYAERGQ